MSSERAWFGAALAAFGIGCSEEPAVDVKSGDVKDAKIEIAPKDVVAQGEVEDDELVVRDGGVGHKTNSADAQGNQYNTRQDRDIKIDKVEQCVGVEAEEEFKNVLMEEADGVRPGEWMKDGYDAEVVRLKVKLVEELKRNKFSNSDEQLMKFFVPRKDEAKNDVIGLLSAVKEGKETKFFVNSEYRDKVKRFVEKYSKQYGVPVGVVYGVMAIENGGKHDPRKNSADGAYGIMQVQPGVVEHLQEMKFNGEDWKGVLVADLEGNIRAGTAYLKYLHENYGQYSFDLMAYNAGPAAFERDMAAAVNWGLAHRAGIKKEIRSIKAQIKLTEKEKKDNYEQIIADLQGQLKLKQEELLLDNDKWDVARGKIRKKEGGWEKFLSDKNIWRVCSKHGYAMCENSNAGYPVDAMLLSGPIQGVMTTQDEMVKLDFGMIQ